MPTWPGWPNWQPNKPKLEAEALRLKAGAEYEKALEMLEKMENDSAEKASQEDRKVNEFIRAEKKTAAIQCLKRKMLYDENTEQFGDFQYRIHDQRMRLVRAKATIVTLDTLRTGAAALEAMQKANNIADAYDDMDEINGQHKTMEQIEKVVSASHGAAAFFDKDKLEAKVEELGGTELGKHLPLTTTGSAGPEHVIGGPLRAPPFPQGSDQEDELADSQAEMAYNIADLDDILDDFMDETMEQHKTMEQIEKDKLEAKVEELEGTELGEQLQLATTGSAGPEHVIGN